LALVLWVARIFQRLEEFLIAGRTANILRRACVGAADAQRVRQGRVQIDDLLDLDFMLPVVAEVVDVREYGPSAFFSVTPCSSSTPSGRSEPGSVGP
jgi:PII-like signaling protein